MKARLRKLWESRSPRDRTIIAVLTVVVVALLYVALVQSAHRARIQLSNALQTLRVQALRMDARDADQVQVVFGSVAFADWLTWVASLQGQNIRVDTGRIEALSTPGLVSVTATFVRAKPQ